MAPRGRIWKHVCMKCNKRFLSGRALGGHMSRHWRIVEQPRRASSPPAIAVDMHVSLLSPSDEDTLLPSSGTQCPVCSKMFSSFNSLRGHMREHIDKKVLSKPVEGAVGLMEAADGDYNVMLSPTVKRKRSKRETPVLSFDVIDAAVTLLLLSEHSKKISTYQDFYAEDMDSMSHNGPKGVNQNAFDHQLVQCAELKKPKGHKCSAYDDFYGQCKYANNLISKVSKDNTLTPNFRNYSAYEDCYGQCEKDNSLIPNVPKKNDKNRNLIPNVHEKESTLISSVTKTEVELNVLAGDAELRKLRTNSSVVMKCGDLSAAVKVKRHQCNACGKSFGSGQALGGHMTPCNRRHGFANCPDSFVAGEQEKKIKWVSQVA